MRNFIILIESNSVLFRNEIHEFHHGQSDQTLFAIINKKIAGRIDYSVYREIPHIQMIKVIDRRKGIGTALLRQLQSLFPETEIEWGMMTNDGMALRNSLQFKKILDLEIQEKFDTLERCEKRLALIKTKTDEFISNLPKPFPRESFSRLNSLNDALNALEHRVENLKYSLHNKKPYKLIIQ